ncbi:hypothetical protein bthur0014_63610 [Bacillus thuringiensis IBL 4222]|nr:hypothetical protein bthur0014_63610 [Bacillus thuringiensis IBL 4222]
MNDIQSVYVSKEIAKEMSIIISERNMSKKYKRIFGNNSKLYLSK